MAPNRSKEAAVKKSSTSVLVGLAVLSAFVPALRAQEMGPEALIGRARAVVLSPHFSRDEITKALVDVLDASLQILPKTDQNKECMSRIEAARKTVGAGHLFADESYESLGLAYKAVSSGQAWKVPEELAAGGQGAHGIEQATKICAKLLDAAAAAYRTGRNEEAVRDLLGMVILVVTPIETAR
jgi:hypothetical protein